MNKRYYKHYKTCRGCGLRYGYDDSEKGFEVGLCPICHHKIKAKMRGFDRTTGFGALFKRYLKRNEK